MSITKATTINETKGIRVGTRAVLSFQDPNIKDVLLITVENGNYEIRREVPGRIPTKMLPEVDEYDPAQFRMFDALCEAILDYDRYVPKDELRLTVRPIELGLDSLDFIELVMHLEDKFNIELPDSELEKCITLADMCLLLEKYVKDPT